MATLGMTKLEAANQMLEAVGEMPVAALDTGGTSIEGEAERILDRISEKVQARGWPENTDLGKSLTATAAGAITAPSDTLRIKPVGSNEDRTLVLQEDSIYDADNATAVFSSGESISFDIVKELTFANCSPPLKHLIATEASIVFQRRKVKDEEQDAFLAQERNIDDIFADHRKIESNRGPLNFQPLIISQQGRERR